MGTTRVVECARTTVGEINTLDRVFNTRIIAGRVGEKLEIPEDQIIEEVLLYLKDLVALGILQCTKILPLVGNDTALWVESPHLHLFRPSLEDLGDSSI